MLACIVIQQIKNELDGSGVAARPEITAMGAIGRRPRQKNLSEK
jgi:hypothetical protein